MVYIFKISSEEKEDFALEIKIKSEQTFLKLHNLIQDCVGYDASQIASFYTISYDGQREKEVALFEMSSEEEELDVMVMDVTMIKELLDDTTKELIYVYDFFSDRYFNIKLKGTEKEELSIQYPICSLVEGNAPKQILMDDIQTMGNNDFSTEQGEKDILKAILEDDDYDDDITFESLDDYSDIL